MNNLYNKLENIPVQEQLIMANNKIYIDDIDPYNLLDTKPLSLEKLLSKYNILRIKNHPDKGGDSKNFITINNSINNIKFILKVIDSDKQFTNLRSDFYDSINNETNNKIIAELVKNGDFDIKRFNTLFEEHKFDDMDDGYASIMTNEDITKPKKIDFKNFHDKFKSKKKNNSKSIISHNIPEPNNNNEYCLIAGNNNYTRNNYSDYKQAFDESLMINEDNIVINKRTINDIEKERSANITKLVEMTDIEKENHEKYINNTNKKESDIKKSIENYDFKLKKYNEQINNIFINYK